MGEYSSLDARKTFGSGNIPKLRDIFSPFFGGVFSKTIMGFSSYNIIRLDPDN